MKWQKEMLMNEIRRHPTALNIASGVEFKITVVKNEQYPKILGSELPHILHYAYLTSKKYYETHQVHLESIARVKQQVEPVDIPKKKVLPKILRSSIKNPQRQKTKDLIYERGKVLGGEKGRELPSQYHETPHKAGRDFHRGTRRKRERKIAICHSLPRFNADELEILDSRLLNGLDDLNQRITDHADDSAKAEQ